MGKKDKVVEPPKVRSTSITRLFMVLRSMRYAAYHMRISYALHMGHFLKPFCWHIFYIVTIYDQ